MTMQTDIVSSRNPHAEKAGKGHFIKALVQNRLLIAIVFLYFLAGTFVSAKVSAPLNTVGLDHMKWILLATAPVFFGSMIIWRFGHMVFNVRPEKPIGWLMRDLRDTLIFDRERVYGGMIAVVGIIYFAAVFSFIKDNIPLLNPFSWDPTFAEWDRLLHGGVDPYILLAPVFGNPFMTNIADNSYSLWFLMVYYFAFTACMDKENPIRRNTFLFAFLLTWIIGGTILAIIFSSVGPVYYQDFGFGDQFVPLMESLRQYNEVQTITALELQAVLLEGYQNDGDLKGISAMPSMHVALSWIMAFQAFQYRKSLGWAMVGFAILIQLSSVHLAWHYAIDGYLGFVVAALCWVAAKKLAKLQSRFDRQAAV